MLVNEILSEYIHFVHGLNGQTNTGVMKGGYRGSTIFTLKRYFNRIEFEVQNNSFYYDPKNPLSKSSNSKNCLFDYWTRSLRGLSPMSLTSASGSFLTISGGSYFLIYKLY